MNSLQWHTLCTQLNLNPLCTKYVLETINDSKKIDREKIVPNPIPTKTSKLYLARVLYLNTLGAWCVTDDPTSLQQICFNKLMHPFYIQTGTSAHPVTINPLQMVWGWNAVDSVHPVYGHSFGYLTITVGIHKNILALTARHELYKNNQKNLVTTYGWIGFTDIPTLWREIVMRRIIEYITNTMTPKDIQNNQSIIKILTIAGNNL